MMKNPAICKSECNTWYVVAITDRFTDYCVVFEGKRRKDCVQFLAEHSSEIIPA